jgi:hypothetical protein
MSKDSEPEFFRTLRGFLRGEEPDEETYFRFSATLRIHGDALLFDEISSQLGVSPSHQHHKGVKRSASAPAWRDDAWHFSPDIPGAEPLERHIQALWEVVAPHVEYLKSLKGRYKVDVFCGYHSNSDTAGFEVPHTCLELFTALEVPFGISVIIA